MLEKETNELDFTSGALFQVQTHCERQRQRIISTFESKKNVTTDVKVKREMSHLPLDEDRQTSTSLETGQPFLLQDGYEHRSFD